MNPLRDAFIIIGIIVALAVVSFGIRGGVSNRSFGNMILFPSLYVTQPQTNTGSSISNGVVEPKEQTAEDIEKEIARIEAEIVKVQAELAHIEKYGETSPYKGMVTIRKSASTLSPTNVDAEQIRLDVSRSSTKNIVLSNWKLESAISGRSVSIPKAVRLVFAGSSGGEESLIAKPGDAIYITTGRSPIGQSFRVNKCTGYYAQFQNFNPGLQRQCPDPKVEILSYKRDQSIFIDNVCMDFVERIQKCTVQTKPLPLRLSASCQEAIVNEIGYNSCVDKHKSDADFFSPEWRIYLKRDLELWRVKREIIKLLDENGKTVDYYTY